MRPAQVTPPAPAFGGPAAPQVLFLALRDMVLIGGLLLVLFGTTAPAHRPHLPTLALVLAAYKGGMYVWFWSGRGRRARLVFGLTADILFLNALVHTTGGVGSHMDLLLFVLIALYAAQFGRAAGLWAAAIATSGYALAVGVDGVPADRWAAVGTRAALFWLQGGTVGWLAQRERRARACAEQLNAELHDTLARLERTQADLVRAEKLAAIGQMASKMAHEIRNPLGAMALNLGLLEERLGGRLDDVRDMVGALRDQIGALTGLSEDYLRLGRLPRPRPEPLDVSHLVASLGELLRGELAARGITLRTSAPPDLPPLSADPGLLRQATFNLLKNALEAVAPGGTVGIEARAEAGTFRLTVWDDGPGIGPDADRIFEPFYTTKEDGNGLGLAVARQIVRDHGGELTCEAGRGRGARFTVRLPLKFAEALDGRSGARGGVGPGSG